MRAREFLRLYLEACKECNSIHPAHAALIWLMACELPDEAIAKFMAATVSDGAAHPDENPEAMT